MVNDVLNGERCVDVPARIACMRADATVSPPRCDGHVGAICATAIAQIFIKIATDLPRVFLKTAPPGEPRFQRWRVWSRPGK
jgi:hypothetical protein